jgi:hypothetical protein
MNTKAASLWSAQAALKFLKSLRAHVEALVGDDEAAIRDTIEGEADVDALLGDLIAHRQSALAMAEARRALAKRYSSAATADEERAEKIEGMILEALQAAGQEKWSGPAGTVGVRAGSWSVQITNPMHVPLNYQVAEVSKKRLKEELEGIRKELSGLALVDLIKVAREEHGITYVSTISHADLMQAILAKCIPGAALVLGEPGLAIHLPRAKRDAA